MASNDTFRHKREMKHDGRYKMDDLYYQNLFIQRPELRQECGAFLTSRLVYEGFAQNVSLHSTRIIKRI